MARKEREYIHACRHFLLTKNENNLVNPSKLNVANYIMAKWSDVAIFYRKTKTIEKLQIFAKYRTFFFTHKKVKHDRTRILQHPLNVNLVWATWRIYDRFSHESKVVNNICRSEFAEEKP